MPTIPNLIQDSVQLDTGTGRQRVQASPDAFGAQEAQALQSVSRGLGVVADVAEQKVDEADEAEVLELDNEYSRRIRERLYAPETGYLSTARGRAAIDGREQVESDLDGIAAEIAQRARNPRVAAAFQGVAQRRLGSALGDVATYAADQTRTYHNEQSEGRINEFMDNAVAAYGDEAVVQANMMGAIGELERVRQRAGWSDEIYQSRVRQLRSDMTSRVIVQLAGTDPEAAQELYARVRPELSSDEAGQLLTTMRAAQREAEEGALDEAWAFVAGGQRIPADVWARVPGRARIDIQNEQRRRAEGGAGTGNRQLYNDMRVLMMDDPDAFARADLGSQRGALGDENYLRLRAAQQELRQGAEPADVAEQRTQFNAIRDVAATTLNLDLTPAQGASASDRRRAADFNASLLRHVETWMASNPGQGIDTETAQVLIGRAWVSMRGRDVSRDQGNVPRERGRSGARDGNRGTAVAATTEVVVPYAQIPRQAQIEIATRLNARLGRAATRGEIENAYAAYLQGIPLGNVLPSDGE